MIILGLGTQKQLGVWSKEDNSYELGWGNVFERNITSAAQILKEQPYKACKQKHLHYKKKTNFFWPNCVFASGPL